MKAELQQERTAITLPKSNGGAPRGGGARWAAIAISLAVAALAIGTFATLQGQPSSPGTRAVYLDPMTAAREGGPYVQPAVGPYVDAMTALREGQGYGSSAGAPVGAMTWIRENGPYASPRAIASQDPMTAEREGGSYETPAP